jgi:signal transduction histidine kinase
MIRLALWQRLSLVFALLLLVCVGASAWLQTRDHERHEQEVIQRLSLGLAAHIADNAELMKPAGLDPGAVHALFDKLMDVNPSVEVYLLAADGRILAQAAPPGHLKRDHVDLEPIRQLASGAMLPILGDDPRNGSVRKVFSAAPLIVDGREAGYVYVVLQGEAHDLLADNVAKDNTLARSLWTLAMVAALGMVAGLAAFRWITRPLRRLTDDVGRFEADGSVTLADDPVAAGSADIAMLRQAFSQMAHRIAEQWRDLSGQDQQRRELVANISHDLRTPLTSLHGYLETMRLKADVISDEERARYLDVAIGQSLKVGRLAQELFELARLEIGIVKPDKAPFSLPDLVQDVFAKFELAASSRRQRLVSDIAQDLPPVTADFGLIERVMTNLLDNAIRHTPEGGEIEVRLRREGSGVDVQVSDTGPGIPENLQRNLFVRPSFQSGDRDSGGGLGLVIVQRILQLHDSHVRLVRRADRGAVFRFQL